MSRNERSFQYVYVDSLVFNFARNKTQSEIDQIEIAKVTRVSNFLSGKFLILGSISHELHLQGNLRFDHHVGSCQVTMDLIILVQCTYVLANFFY